MQTQQKPLILLILGACVIGLSPIFVRLSETGPVATAFWRLALSLPPLYIWSRQSQSGPIVRKDWLVLILAGFFFAADLSVWHLSLGNTTVANSTLLANFAPLFVALLSWLLFKVRMGWGFFAGLILAVSGMGLLVGLSAKIGGTNLKGDLLALSAAVFYAGYLLSVKDLRNRVGSATILFVSGAVSCAVLLPLGIVSGEILLPAYLNGWLVLVGLALICHVAGQGLITHALAHLPAHFASVTLLLQPVVAALCAAALFSESLTMLKLAGGILILIGILLARKDAVNHERKDA